MDFNLAKCARCKKLFNRILSEVCTACQPEEDADYRRIRDVLTTGRDLNAQEVAEEAGVGVECVIRMLREGRIDNVEHDSDATCGRCGAPAISETKRLCQRCLVNLDRECAQAMHEMRARLLSKQGTDMNKVQEAVELRKAPRHDKRRESTPAAAKVHGQRMVVPQHLRRTGKGS